jgi:O-antigen ligase
LVIDGVGLLVGAYLFVFREQKAKHAMVSGPDRPASDKISSLLVLGVVMLAPLPFGSVGPLSIVTWCIVFGVALSLTSLRSLDRRHIVVLAGVATIICAYLLVIHEQVSLRPFFAASLADPVWEIAADTLGAKLEPSISMIRDQPLLALGAPLAAILSLLVGFIVCVDRDHAHRLIRVMAWSGTAYAVYGIAAFFIDPTRVLWEKKEAYFTVLTSTFVNRNTAAVYFGSCVILWLLILLDRLRRNLPHHTTPSLTRLIQPLRQLQGAVVIEFGALFACLVAMFLTGSRAGVMLALLAIVMALGLFTLKSLPLGRGPLRLGLAVTCVVVLLTEVLGGGVLGRFDREGFAGGGRAETYRSTLAIIEDHPWLGTGLGTFAFVFPAYRGNDWTSWGTWDRAHNTPLEIASEMGVPLAGVVVAAWFGAFAVMSYGLWSRKRDHIVVIAALSVASLAILHSLIDFSLQIPGFAIGVFALVGAGLAQSFRSDHGLATLRDPPSTAVS